jgi:peroxiredoxin
MLGAAAGWFGFSRAENPSPTPPTVAEEGYPLATLPNCTGGELSLGKARGKVATVLVTIAVDCPISSEYIPTLNLLADRWRPRGVNLISINPNQAAGLDEMADHARKFKLTFPFLKDPSGKITRSLQFKVTPEVCVFDAAGKPVYRGRIDDRYRTHAPGAAISTDLERALDEVIAGKPVSQAATKAIGCPIQ